MNRHFCKQCGEPFNYCRACVISPIPYKASGFCSKECSVAFKAAQNQKEVIQEDVEVVINNEDTSTSESETVEYPHFFTEIEEENDINDNKQNYGEEL